MTENITIPLNKLLAWEGNVRQTEPDKNIAAGIVQPEDRRNATEKVDEATAHKSRTAALPTSLIQSLTQRRTEALNLALASRPDVALAALVYCLVTQAFPIAHREANALRITLYSGLLAIKEGPAHDLIWAGFHQWWAKLPKPEELLDWCLKQEREELLRLLAHCVAESIDVVPTRSRHSKQRVAIGDVLALALDLDMTKWFTPTAENYFGRLSKAQILEALKEAKGCVEPEWASMKTADLAALAEREIAGTGWLPTPLRAAPKAID